MDDLKKNMDFFKQLHGLFQHDMDYFDIKN